MSIPAFYRVELFVVEIFFWFQWKEISYTKTCDTWIVDKFNTEDKYLFDAFRVNSLNRNLNFLPLDLPLPLQHAPHHDGAADRYYI